MASKCLVTFAIQLNCYSNVTTLIKESCLVCDIDCLLVLMESTFATTEIRDWTS